MQDGSGGGGSDDGGGDVWSPAELSQTQRLENKAVTLAVDGRSTRTDETGRFLLTGPGSCP